jgi:hypothetical protein
MGERVIQEIKKEKDMHEYTDSNNKNEKGAKGVKDIKGRKIQITVTRVITKRPYSTNFRFLVNKITSYQFIFLFPTCKVFIIFSLYKATRITLLHKIITAWNSYLYFSTFDIFRR